MRKLILGLDRILTPLLLLSYLGLCIILLAVSPGLSAFLAMLWGGAMMTALRWGIWGILTLGRRMHPDRETLKILTRTVEVIQIFLILAAVALAVLLWSIPSVWLLIPAACYGLRGAIHFDAEYL